MVKWLDKSFRFLASRELAVILLLVLCIVLIPQTVKEQEYASLGAIPRILFGCLALNLVFCTVRGIRSLSKAVIVIHVGAFVTLVGSVIGSFGFVSTVNIYEGTSVDTAYRWEAKQDMPLGFDLMVKKINLEYYPVPVRVGVLRGDEKIALFELKTGESFRLDRYTVTADSVEFPSEDLRLRVFDGDRLAGSADTEGTRNLPHDFPYDFKLVAFKTPAPKRAEVLLAILKDSQVAAEGSSAVNSPLTWGKLNFYNTSVKLDSNGVRYAGIQITYDPGRPFVYWGFALIGIGSGMYLVRKVYGYR